MDREAWWATVHGVAKSWTRLSSVLLAAFFHMVSASPTLPHPGGPCPGPRPPQEFLFGLGVGGCNAQRATAAMLESGWL